MEELLNEREVDTMVTKCPSCGAELVYDVQSGNLKCDHCGTIKVIEEDNSVQRREISDEILGARAEWADGTVHKCDNCGAKEVLNKSDISKICPFCGSGSIVPQSELAGVQPDSVIPFQITKDGAETKFGEWLRTRWFAPTAFKHADIREKINSLYCPNWLFSAKTESTYDGALGKWQTRTDSQGRSHSYIRYYRVNGSIAQDYFDYCVQSGAKISPAIFNKIKPFNLNLLKVYRQEYLSGIVAEHYSRNLETCFNDFAGFVKADLRGRIIRRHNADVVQSLNINVTYRDKKFNYVLLPIYICNYKYAGKDYNFYVNGVDGKVVGYYPKSKTKIFFAIFGGLLLLGGLIVAGALLGGLLGLF